MEPLEQRTLLSVTVLEQEFKAMEFTATGTFSGSATVPSMPIISYGGTANVEGTLHYQDPEHGIGSGTGSVSGSFGSGLFQGSFRATGAGGHPRIAVDDVVILEGDSGTTVALFPVFLSAPVPRNQPVTVDYQTIDGTATAGEDYEPVYGTITFPADNSQPQMVAVEIHADVQAEWNEQFLLRLSNADGAVIDDETGIGVILNDDGSTSAPDLPSVSVEGTWAQEGDNACGFLPFGLNLSQPSDTIVTVIATTSPGTATPVEDYQPFTATVTFLPGETEKFLAVPVIGDTVEELNETVFIYLWDPVNALIGRGTAMGVIVDDDSPPRTFVINDISVGEGDAGERPAVFTVRREGPTEDPLMVDYHTSDGTATANSDYRPTSGSITFEAGQASAEVTVMVIGDTLIEQNETFSLNVGSDQGTCTILDDDLPPPSPPRFDPAAVEGHSGSRDTVFPVFLTTPSSTTVTVEYATVDGTALAGSDYEATSGTLTFAPGETEQKIYVPVKGDTLTERDEHYFIRLFDASSPNVHAELLVGTILDDDGGVFDDGGVLTGFGQGLTIESDDAGFPLMPYLPGFAGPYSATGTLDVSQTPFLANVQWNDCPIPGGTTTGRWDGTVTPRADEPFDTFPTSAFWTADGVQFAFEVTGPVQPTPNRLTPISNVCLYWASGPDLGDVLGGAIADPVPIYWNQAGGEALATDLPSPPAQATHLLVVTNPDNSPAEANRQNNVLALDRAQGTDLPSAAPDTYSREPAEDQPLFQDALHGVLANDTDPSGQALTALLVAGPSHGTLVLNEDGSFVYTPAEDYHGSDRFFYKATHGANQSNVAMVMLTVNSRNDRPAAVADMYLVEQGSPLVVYGSGVLRNDHDVDNDPLMAILVDGPAHGSLSLNADGSFRYSPEDGYFGDDGFTYKARDGRSLSDATTVTIHVTRPGYDLGPVDFQQIFGLDPSSGDYWYELQTTHDGLLTLQARNPDVSIVLYDSSLHELASSALQDGGQRLDREVSAGETYFFKLSGGPTDLTLTNLVRREEGTVTVYGTQGNDQFVLQADPCLIDVNGTVYTSGESPPTSISVDGGAGQNSVTLIGTGGTEQVWFWPGSASATAGGIAVVVAHAATITADGNGGGDTAVFHDASAPPGNDTLTMTMRYGTPAGTHTGPYGGGTYTNVATGFRTMEGYSHAGNDVAQLYDTDGDDSFVANLKDGVRLLKYGAMADAGKTYSLSAEGFTCTYAYASKGVDVASLYDSAGDDYFKSERTQSVLRRGTSPNWAYYTRATSFDYVHAYASTGRDKADLYGSAGSDTFSAWPDVSILRGTGFYNRAKYFDVVYAKGEGGSDVARMYDYDASGRSGSDAFTGKYNESTMSGLVRRAGVNETYKNVAQRFRTVKTCFTKGNDTANLYDSPTPTTVDRLAAAQDWAKLYSADLAFSYLVSGLDTTSDKVNVFSKDWSRNTKSIAAYYFTLDASRTW